MPLTEWLFRSTVLAVLVSLAAWALETLLRGWGRPARFVWIVALFLSAALPLLAVWSPDAWPDVMRRVVVVQPLPPVTESVNVSELAAVLALTAAPPAQRLSPALLLLGLWLCASAVFTLRWLHGWWRLRRARRTWQEVQLRDCVVLVSQRFGPAVVGLRVPRIVLPGWLLRGDASRLRMVMQHESEHARAGDQWLLALAPLVALLFPLNPGVWWQLRRLRLSVEMDCDARVIRAGESALDYGTMLLDVASGVPIQPTLATLTEPRTFLERRIRAMSVSRGRISVVRALALFGLAMMSMFGAALAGAPSQSVLAQQPAVAPKAPPAARTPQLVAPAAPALHPRPGTPALRTPPSSPAPALSSPAPGAPQPVFAPGIAPSATPKLSKPPGRVSLPAPVTTPSSPAMPQVQQREPILVVDGVVLGNQNRLDAIVNRMRITSVEVLNAVEATRRFGEQGRYGAVLIMTAPPEAASNADQAAAPRLRVRADGQSVTANPLIIVDGVVVPAVAGDKSVDVLATLSPDLIDRIEVIKGQAAVQLYGERGREGVIVIYTKKK